MHGRKLLPTSLRACKKPQISQIDTDYQYLLLDTEIYPPDVWRIEL